MLLTMEKEMNRESASKLNIFESVPFQELLTEISTALESIDKKYNPNRNDSLLTFNEACNFLNIKPNGLRKMVYDDKIPVKRIGKRLRFKRSEIEEHFSLVK